ncbi:MAG TPA: exodeoxyribonuclease VII large subunit, partial [Leptospiraceae bacterium]|nr:exodeoxyribonuclease VII large subunit [Leptospiraceae bacterium]
HEIDHPISDLAADDFAPTPSAAVLKVLPLMSEITERIEECALRLRLSLVHSHTRGRRRLLQILNSKIHKKPAAMLEIWQMRMDQMHRSFNLGMQSRLHSNSRRLEKFDHFGMHFKAGLKRNEERFKLLEERLTNFSPLATLRRGYSLVRDKDKKVIRSAAQVERGDEIEIMLSQGRLKAKVTEALKE